MLNCASLKSNLDNLALFLTLCSNKHLTFLDINKIYLQSIICSKLSSSRSIGFSCSLISKTKRKTSIIRGFFKQVSLTSEVLDFKSLGSTRHGIKENGRFFKACSNKLKNSFGSSFSKASSNQEMK